MTDSAPPEDAAHAPVALDAMGGDRAPGVVVDGAVEACRRGDGPILLVGDRERVEAELGRHKADDLPIEVRHAGEVIGMAENPGRAARTKRDSSMHVGFGLVKSGEACAFVSAGNSGAMMAVGLLVLRRVPRCDRPAIATSLPTRDGHTVLLDLGANVECRASHLVQFAMMGAAYAAIELKNPRPTVGLLSNGSEPSKGTETLREAHRLLNMTDLKYLGYVEGRSLPLGEADVVVTDGFVGNVVLKLSEGIALALVERVRRQLEGDWLGTLGAPLFKRAMRRLRDELDWESVGGAPLLGLDGIGLVAHGGSSPRAVANAVRRARGYHRVGLVGALRGALEDSGFDEMTSTAELPLTRQSGSHTPEGGS